MKPRTLLWIAIACFVGAAVVLAVSVVWFTVAYNRMWSGVMSVMDEGLAEGDAPPPAPKSNGERIYVTGVNEAGQVIPFTGGPHWLAMHGGSCADCHGSDGRGGGPIMGTGEIAPDIRYESLTGGEEEHGEEAEHEHERYTDDDIKRAITEGVEPDGARLSATMPRWQMSEQDMQDLLDYLKELDGD